jgi:Fe2+ transport system protein FeoA
VSASRKLELAAASDELSQRKRSVDAFLMLSAVPAGQAVLISDRRPDDLRVARRLVAAGLLSEAPSNVFRRTTVGAEMVELLAGPAPGKVA